MIPAHSILHVLFQDWAGLECFNYYYNIIMFSSLATHSMVNLFTVSGTPIVTFASLFIRLTYSLATPA